jgi:hypothetical protein
MTHVILLHVDQTPIVTMEFVLACQNTKAILIQDVVRNVYSILTVRETKLVFGINVLILVRVLVDIMPFVK